MLRPRVIPCLLLHGQGLVKTRGFSAPTYVGDPVNAVRIFNEKEVDELMVLDIGATARQHEPQYALIRQLAAECRMPLAYGGGVRSVDQVERIVQLGVEKVAISAAAIMDPGVIAAAAHKVGSQSIAVVADHRKTARGAEVFTHNGTRATGLTVEAVAASVEQLGAGEIVINDIARDGMGIGYDLEVVAKCIAATRLPMTVIGGVGHLRDIGRLFERFGTIGAAAGSLFVFKGKLRAVLISYPDRKSKDALTAMTSAGYLA